jgi:putative glutamine amidotransferase
VRSLADAGALPWLIPLLPGDETTLRGIYEILDGVFLAGGVDLDPALYGEPRHPRCDQADPVRDRTEVALVRWAVAEGKPAFGVCRGIQTINVACGGSLYQHLPEEFPGPVKHDCFSTVTGLRRDHLAHPVRILPDSRLAGILGALDLPVNSMHHQGIKRLAPGLVASAHAPDGLIEAIERPGATYLVGVQWHPEELTDTEAPMRALFRAFVQAALSFRSAR